MPPFADEYRMRRLGVAGVAGLQNGNESPRLDIWHHVEGSEPAFDSGDHLHPGDACNKDMADSIGLGVLFGNR